jgi:cell division protein ZapE
MPGTLPAAYAAELSRHDYQPDAAQSHAIARLEALRLSLRRSERHERSLVHRLEVRLGRVPAREPVPGIYLWGSVGRGKTFLMDLLHAHAGVPARRTHFHRFMQEVHGGLRGNRDLADPLGHVAAAIASGCRLLCLDELFVSDIADAMILAGLFEGLVANGVTLAFTSNAPPRELYRDGLQRQRFVPAIELIERNTEVVQVDGGMDYRLRQLERAPLFVSTRTHDAERLLARCFEAIAGHPGTAGGTLEVEGRQIEVRQRHAGVVWFDFAALCAGPRSQADYIEIARTHHTVVISGVPRFDPSRDDEARRFIALVDEFYDRGVKLALSAEGPPGDLYRGERLAFDFARTASRLAEMQTHAYLERPHRP